MNRQQVSAFAVALLLICTAAWGVTLQLQVNDSAQRITGLQETNEDLEALLVHRNSSTSNDRTPNPYSAHTVGFSAFAYSSTADRVYTIPVELHSVPGNGVYMNLSEVRYQSEFQASVQVARRVVENSSYSPEYSGFVLSIDTPESWDYVGGISAGLPVALALAATDPTVELDPAVAATGGLRTTGGLIQVSHIKEKAKAARAAGKEILLVPRGQAVDIDGIQVIEVYSFADAAEHALLQDPTDTSQS